MGSHLRVHLQTAAAEKGLQLNQKARYPYPEIHRKRMEEWLVIASGEEQVEGSLMGKWVKDGGGGGPRHTSGERRGERAETLDVQLSFGEACERAHGTRERGERGARGGLEQAARRGAHCAQHRATQRARRHRHADTERTFSPCAENVGENCEWGVHAELKLRE